MEYASLETASLARVDDSYYYGAYCRRCTSTGPDLAGRDFDKDEYARRFGRRRIWITTLDYCRRIEDAQRRDEGELTYRSGMVQGDTTHPDNEIVARRRATTRR